MGEFAYYDELSGVRRGRPNFVGKISDVRGEFSVGVRLDRYGFRNDDQDSDSTNNYVLGDSFVFGWGVEDYEVFTEIVGESIGSKVRNLGVPGADVYDYLRILEFMGVSKNPGFVAVSVTMENDVNCYGNHENRNSVSDSKPFLRESVDYLTRLSAFFSVGSAIAKSNPIVVEAVRRSSMLVSNNDKLSSVCGGNEKIESTKSLLKIIQKISIESNKKFIIIIVPPRPPYNKDSVYVDFVDELKRDGLDVLNLEVFYGNPGLIFPVDGHWNSKGHQIAAEALIEFLER